MDIRRLQITAVHLASIAFMLTAVQTYAFRTADCSRCHGSISAEWSASLHADAYRNELFRNELVRRNAAGKTSCACHAPDIYMPGGMGQVPSQRADSLEYGVDCISCHMDRQMTAYSADYRTTVPHFVEIAQGMNAGAACAGCHSWIKDQSAPCQECHMPEVDGPVSDAPINDRSVSSSHRSHRFRGVGDREFLAGALDFAVEEKGGSLAVTVTSLVSFHKVPQSNFRKLVLVITGKDGSRENQVFSLEPDGSFSFEIDSAKNIAKVEIRLYPSPEIQPDNSILIAGRNFE